MSLEECRQEEGPASAPTEMGGTPRSGRMMRRMVAALTSLTAFLALALLVRTWILTPFRIPSASMEPTILGKGPGHPGDTILVNRLAYLGSDPARWDAVAFRAYERESSNAGDPISMVKRVVGLPGETVEIAGGEIYINGSLVEKPPSLDGIVYLRQGEYGLAPVKLESGEYFVLGDNSRFSRDSRRFGPIQRKSIFGRADWIILPLNRRGKLR